MSNIYGDGSGAPGTGSTVGAQTITHYYDRSGIKAANEVNVYGQWADKRHMPTKMGKEFKTSKFLHIYDRKKTDALFSSRGYLTARDYEEAITDIGNASLTEGAKDVNDRNIEKITVTQSFQRYGEMIKYTDEVELFSEDYIQVRYREELGRLANRRMEDLIQKDMLSTSTVMYASEGLEDTDVSQRVSYDLIRKASRKLVRNRAEKHTSIVTGSTKVDTRTINKAYYAIIGPEVKYDLEKITIEGSTSSATFNEYAYIPAYKYGDASRLAEGEVGAMGDMRFIESESAFMYQGQGAPLVATGVMTALAGAGIEATDDTTLQAYQYTDVSGKTQDDAGDIAEIVEAIISKREKVVVLCTAAGTSVYTNGEYYEIDYITDYTDAIADGATFTVYDTYLNVFPILIPTKGAFATIGLKGKGKIKFNSQSPNKIELSNPYGTQGFFSYNFWYAGIVLEDEKLLKVLVAASE